MEAGEWRAECGCGWVGPRRMRKTDADLDAKAHIDATGHLPPE